MISSSSCSDPYEAAGGGIVRDLFAEDATTLLSDRPLLVKLAGEKLEQAAETLNIEGWKWVEINLDPSALYNGGYSRIYAETRGLAPDEQAELSTLGDMFDEIAARIETYAEGDSAIEADEAQLYEIERKIESIKDAAKAYDPAEQALAGCIVTIGNTGALQIGTGYVKAEDRAELARLQHDGEADEEGDDAALSAAPEAEPETGYSAAFIEELTAIRTAALANLNAVRAKHDHSRERLQQAEQIAVAVKLDMRQFWTPEAAFLSRLSKAQIAEVMQEAGCSKDAIKAVGKAPKAEAVAQAKTALRGKTWLPALLRGQQGDEADDAEAMAIAAE